MNDATDRGRIFGQMLADTTPRRGADFKPQHFGWQVSGKVATLTIDPPKTTIAINALPWAEVWMDGTKIGETPIGNLAVSAGSHDLVFRHPELGERRETVLATFKSPVRVSVDMRKP